MLKILSSAYTFANDFKIFRLVLFSYSMEIYNTHKCGVHTNSCTFSSLSFWVINKKVPGHTCPGIELHKYILNLS